MRKMKKLALHRETVRRLVGPADLRDAAGGVTLPITHCNQSVCIDTCKFCTRPPCPQ
ncbi:MAG TPA: hypothetical protein VHG32_13370 [Thermoanaerobaculia bacterium]|jgi:hypothetical protein|nr:hypothetical protein [Thermoanaerobaculia bacterium]